MAEPAVNDAAWRPDAERAHALILRAVAVLEASAHQAGDLRAAGARTEEALGHLYDAFDQRRDPLAAALAAQEAFRDVADLIERRIEEEGALTDAVNVARRAAGHLDAVAAVVAKLPAQPAAAPRALPSQQASVGVPRVHAQNRASVVPKLRLPVPPPTVTLQATTPSPTPTSFEELEGLHARIEKEAEARVKSSLAAVAKPREETPPPLTGEQRFVDRWARDLFDEVAMLGMQRHPMRGDDWRVAEPLERRLLQSIDAFVALGPRATAQLETLALDAPVQDPTRMFALGLIAGCLEGRDVLGLAEYVARDGAEDPLFLEAMLDACCLAPHPQLGHMLAGFADDSDPALRRVAGHVLAFHQLLDEPRMLTLADDRPRVAATVMVALAKSNVADADVLLERAADAAHPVLRQAAWRGLALRSRDRCLTRLRAADPAEAATLLGILGTDDDAARLLDQVRRAPTAAAIEALAWAGRSPSVPILIGLMRHGDEELALACGAALERITGAGLIDDVALAADDLADRELPEPDLGTDDRPPLSLDELVGDPRFPAPEPSPDQIELPSPDPDRWAAWYQEHGTRLPKGRLRRGRPHDARAVLAELEGHSPGGPFRTLLGWELELLTGAHLRFEATDWIARQQLALATWAERL